MNRLGLFSPAISETRIASFPKLSARTDLKSPLEDRVRSYLDVNCSQCLCPGGIGNFDARFDTPLTRQNIVNATVAVTLGIVDVCIVVPGNTAHSVLYQRVTSLVPTVKMPPLISNRVDSQAAQDIRDWINGLTVNPSKYAHACGSADLHEKIQKFLGG